MIRALSASNQSKFLFLLLRPQNPITNSSSLRLCTTPTSQSPYPGSDDSLITEALQLLQSSQDEWNKTDRLRCLLSSASSPPSVSIQITRRLPSSSLALRFFDYLRESSPSLDTALLSSTFQAVLELASREPDAQTKLPELFNTSKEHNLPLTINAATLLMRCFWSFGMVDESLAVFNELDPFLRNTHVRNVLIGLLLKSGRLHDALHVLDEMLQPEAEWKPDEITADIVFSSLLRRERSRGSMGEEDIVELVLKFGEHGVSPNSVWLTKLIAGLTRNGKIARAWDLLNEMMKMGAKVEVASCNALLTALGRHSEFKKMNGLMEKMKEMDIQPDVVTFGILINHSCKYRRVDEALEVFERMNGGKESDAISVRPDVIIYNTLIDGFCKVGRQQEGLGLVERMRSQTGCAPNTVTYNCLIDGFAKAGEIEKARELFDQMIKEGVLPNVITLNTVVDGMCRHGRISAAVNFFNEMQSFGLKGNATTYTVLINAFCNVNNIDKALELFDQMLTKRCPPDAIVYYTLISGLSQAGRLDDASSIASKAKEAGYGLDVVCYNTLIGGFCRKNDIHRAFEMIKEMEEVGVKPDSVTYNSLISFFSKSGNLRTVHRMLKKMIKDGLVPTVVTYGAIIESYCIKGKVDEAMTVFEDMCSASKVPPNTVIYNILINALCKNNDIEQALFLMDQMKLKRVRPNTTTYNAMFKCLKEKKWLEKAFELMDGMIEQACNPDYITMEILTEWLSAVGETHKLRRFVQGFQVQA
ncbi:pentatricopeptide repeat-containing protein [Tripterygium wilfordii]|uniref:Pentatricopeptide repeat-containing protein n=2 Tax=Tripterygium wilfordii TaxID=458696 RepID=A0A7J7CGA8_TRIWF|nr:pentatricopeptide repeat-containing protein [Tripterygium wilfordii]